MRKPKAKSLVRTEFQTLTSGRLPDTRCTGIEIEHERPFAIHRSHDQRFLRLFCRAHNRLAAERVCGEVFIRKKIEAARALT